eukprot:6357172-Prymnesium_polylepis.1
MVPDPADACECGLRGGSRSRHQGERAVEVATHNVREPPPEVIGSRLSGSTSESGIGVQRSQPSDGMEPITVAPVRSRPTTRPSLVGSSRTRTPG